MPSSPDHAIALSAAAQHGAISVRQLRALGLTGEAIEWRVGRGRLFRRHHGVYAVGYPSLSRHGQMCAAVLGAGAGAAICRLSALELWSIRSAGVGAIDVVVPRRARNDLEGVRVRQTRTLPARDVTVRHGIRVTTVSRTIFDLGSQLDPHPLARVLDEAYFRRRLQIVDLERVMRRLRSSNGYPTVVAALELHRTGSAGTRSSPEDALLAVARAAGLVEPRVNVRVRDAHGSMEVDFLWPVQQLVVEVDGHGHERARTQDEDAARGVRLRALGYDVLRVTAAELHLDEAGVARRLGQAVAIAGMRPASRA